MRLMPLPPESRRLRRIARAHAAGDYSQSEYRAARRALLKAMTESAALGEDTYRRDEVTARHGDLNSSPLEITEVSVAGPRWHRRAFQWFVTATGAAVAMMWLSAHL